MENNIFSQSCFDDELVKGIETHYDKIKKAHEEAVKRGIEANTIMLGKNLAYVGGFELIEKHMGVFNQTISVPPMILGMDILVRDLERQYPKGTDFVITHRASTEIDRIRDEAKEELIKELKEMPLRDVLFTLYDDELDY